MVLKCAFLQHRTQKCLHLVLNSVILNEVSWVCYFRNESAAPCFQVKTKTPNTFFDFRSTFERLLVSFREHIKSAFLTSFLICWNMEKCLIRYLTDYEVSHNKQD